MRYDFTSRERDLGQLVFALMLDKKKLTERIVIGRTDEVRRHLEGYKAEIYLDVIRPLGSFLVNFEADPARQWNTNAMILHESYEKVFREEKRWEQAAPVSKYLNAKYESGEPSAMFAAAKTWDEYLNCYNLNHGGDLLIQRLSTLCRPFYIYSKNRPWYEKASEAYAKAIHDEDAAMEIWYPMAKRPFECVVASRSFQPVIAYYMHKIEEWGYVFQECKICGKHFLARSRHYELCSDACRKEQATEARKEYDERIKDDKTEEHDERAYYYWYNRLRKLQKGKTADTEKAAVVSEAFKAFRKEATQRKKQVKAGKITEKAFLDWIFQQQNEVDRLMEEE